MDENNLVLEVKLNVNDFYHFQKDLFYKNQAKYIFTVCLMILVLSIYLMIQNPPFGSNPVLTIMLFLFPLYFLLFFPMRLKKSSAKAFYSSKLLQKEQTYKMSADGIEISSESTQTFIQWNELYTASETKSCFVFFTAQNQGYIIPKQSFNHREDIAKALRSYLKNAPTPKYQNKKWFTKRRFALGCLSYIFIFIAVIIIAVLYMFK